MSPVNRNRLVAALELLAYRTLGMLARVLPRRLLYLLGTSLADVSYRRDRCKRAAVISNLRRITAFAGVHPSAGELASMARTTFRGFSRHLADFLRFGRLDAEQMGKLFILSGREHLDSAFGIGRGVIAFSAHFGSWEMSAAACVALGCRVNGVVLSMKTPRTDRLFQRRRKSRGVRLIRYGRAVRPVIEALRRNELVGLAGDIDYSLSICRKNLMGAPARVPMGIARIAAMSGSPVLPMFIHQLPRGRYLFRIHPPVVSAEGETADSLEERLLKVLEAEIIGDPTQWFVFHDVWDVKASLAVSRREGIG